MDRIMGRNKMNNNVLVPSLDSLGKPCNHREAVP